VEVPFAQGSDILKTGNVDALLTSDPYYSRIIQARTGYLVSHYLQEMPEGLFSLYYASNRDWAEQNPALVRAFRAALDEANAFVTREPVKSRAILAAALKFPPDVAANIVITHLDTNVTQSDIKYWIDTLVDQGVLRTHPDPSRLLFN
jgi:NitT/TauT family transport system substrate-binding protein